MSPENVDRALAELIAALEDAGLRFALMGGYAVVTWGIPRATFDADVLVEDAPERMPAFFAACERRGFVVDDIYKRGWRDRVQDMLLSKVQLFRGGRAVTCDVFSVATEFQAHALAKRVDVDVPLLGRILPVIAPSDLVLFKLLADRPKDRLDVQNVLVVQGVADIDGLRHWARLLGVEDRLDRSLRELGDA